MPQPWTLKKLSRKVLWRPTRTFRTNTQKWFPFHYRGLECKNRKSRNTWSNRCLALEYRMKQGKDNRVLPRERTGHSKHPLPTTQEKTLHIDITRWPTPKSDWLNLCSQRWRALYSQQKQDREVTVAQIHELLIAKFRLKLKKVGKTTRPFRYDLNQIPYDYTVEVRNRSRDLIW